MIDDKSKECDALGENQISAWILTLEPDKIPLSGLLIVWKFEDAIECNTANFVRPPPPIHIIYFFVFLDTLEQHSSG